MKELGKKQEAKLKAIGKRLRELRIEKGYSGYDHFAWENGLQRTTYLRMEQGQNFNMATFLLLLEIHDLTFEEFFKGTGI